jgi:hypothetical protein
MERNFSAGANTKSGYRGVYWDNHRGKWVARIEDQGLRIRLGYFDNAEDAAFLYDDEARRLKGPAAICNFS